MKRTLSIAVGLVGLVVVLGGAGIAALFAYDAGWINYLRPVNRVDMISLKVYGPGETLQGVESYFHVDVQGECGRPLWRLVPDTPNALTVFPDGRRARFHSNVDGDYHVIVTVAGEGRLVCLDSLSFTNLQINDASTEQPAPVAAQAFVPPPPLSVGELTQAALDHVSGDGRTADARVVAGSVRSLVNRIQGGYVEPGADVASEVESHIRSALDGRSENWRPFIDQVHAIIQQRRELGEITTAASAVSCLEEIASTLGRVKD